MVTPELGKIHPRLMQSTVYQNLGVFSHEVLVGPGFGVDNAVIRIGGGKVMIVTTDPLSLIPSLGPEDSAWVSVHLLASDVVTSGFPASYALLDFNLPPHMGDSQFRVYWKSVHHECRNLGISIIGGHTGRFQGCDYTIIGAGTLFAFGSEERYLSSNMARVGDSLLVTKGAAISASAILSRVFPQTVEKEYGKSFLRKARDLFRRITTFEDGLTLASMGVRQEGVSAMHDATEGGVLGAVYEMLVASNVGGEIKEEAIILSDEAEGICRLFSIDPFISLGEGALVAAVRSDRAEEAISLLSKHKIPASIVGRIVERDEGIRVRKKSGEAPLRYPRVDPYWKAYSRAVQQGWK